jgi:chemotaxis protein CheX
MMELEELRSAVRVPLVFALVASTEACFSSILNREVQRSEPALSDGLSRDISGIIGLTGQINGLIGISLCRPLAIRLTSSLLMEDVQTINDDVVDAVGELANMIVGRAKSKLETSCLSITVPTVVVGNNQHLCFPEKVIPVRVGFRSEAGSLNLEIGLVDDWEPDGEDVEVLKARWRATRAKWHCSTPPSVTVRVDGNRGT